MNSIGVFRKGEIDGKAFHIFTSSFSGEAAIDSNGDDLYLFQCPSFRMYILRKTKRKNDISGRIFFPLDVFPAFFNKRSGDQQFEFSVGSDIYTNECKIPLVPLFWCNNKESYSDEFQCGACTGFRLGTDYLFCVTCGLKFHKECVECPLEIKHPSYPFLCLKLYCPPDYQIFDCSSCQKTVSKMIYYCPTNKLIMHPICAMKPIPIVVNHPKRHPHLLTSFPKQAFLPCDVCGLIKELIHSYICAQCVFVVHQDCIYSPYVIRISRHRHRICFTYSLPSGNLSCGVCRREVDNNYGAYSCNKCDDYFVHTRCALREDLWDGKELEGVPEEPEIDVEPPFKWISDGIILHFSHDHHLKRQICRVYDECKFCQACLLPIYEGNYYSCMDQCDFILHEGCANAPSKKYHPLHHSPLTLKVITTEDAEDERYFYCTACSRESCGFMYEENVRLDVRCASVSEPFEYEGHEHPLFLALKPEEENLAICQICQEDNAARKLNCIKCDFIICFKCATLPYKARCKHDKHFLTFKEGKGESDHSGWCDVCERELTYSRKGGFYSCDDYCSTTLHLDCLLGEDMYMKPGQTIQYCGRRAHITRNTMSRPFCYSCKKRCPHRLVFRKKNEALCSLSCLYKT